jgi:hypothetical protein
MRDYIVLDRCGAVDFFPVLGMNCSKKDLVNVPSVTPGVQTEFERFDNAMRQVLTVSKEELLKRGRARERIERKEAT